MIESILMIIFGFAAMGVCVIPVRHSSPEPKKILFGAFLIVIGVMTLVS